MHLSIFDWLIIVGFLLLSLAIGLKYRRRGSKSLSAYFLTGRNLPWYIAGISMVATTFAADTPLAVTELVGESGISGNWLWWNMLIGGMLTTFFFARNWRRAEILTELEFIEIRYSGKEASFLRGFKAVYLGIFMNVMIIAWVNLAMMTIIEVFFDIPPQEAILYVGGLMLLTVIYSTLAGLWGVAMTDSVQFVIAMTASIILAFIVINTDQVGGISGMQDQLPDSTFRFFPQIGGDEASLAGTLSISIGAFLAFIGFQWWASWYPGAEPGGGGYIAQRMMSCKDEKSAVMSTLFFQIAHYCIRPWPWIIVALAALILYPELGGDELRMGYVMAMKDYLPVGLKGLMLTAFLAAYMSTISTQLNWGASYLVNDLYKRFFKPRRAFVNDEVADKHYVLAGRTFTLLIMLIALYVTTRVTTISGLWLFIIECGAGLGLVLILRWYWWRINAWTEIAATIAPFIAYGFAKLYLENIMPDSFLIHRGSFFFTVGVTTIAWLLVTRFTSPVKKEVLEKFYKKVQPDGFWKPFEEPGSKKPGNIRNLFICWISAIFMTYSTLFATGKIIFGQWSDAAIWVIIAVTSGLILYNRIKKTRIFD